MGVDETRTPPRDGTTHAATDADVLRWSPLGAAGVADGPHTPAELVQGVDPLAVEGLVDDRELSAEEGFPDVPRAGIVLAIASMGFFLITLDISIVNVALARIRASPVSYTHLTLPTNREV